MTNLIDAKYMHSDHKENIYSSNVINLHRLGSSGKVGDHLLQPANLINHNNAFTAIFVSIPGSLPNTYSNLLEFSNWNLEHFGRYPLPKEIIKSMIAYKKTIAENLRCRLHQLYNENKLLVDSIRETKCTVYANVKDLLDKYTLFKSELNCLKSSYQTLIENRSAGYDEFEEKKITEYDRSEDALNITEAKLKYLQEHLGILLCFQHKEHHNKVLAIEDLNQQCSCLTYEHDNELVHLQKEIEEEKQNSRIEFKKNMMAIFKRITDKAISNAPQQVVTIVKENRHLHKEVELQAKYIIQLSDEIIQLDLHVKNVKVRFRESKDCIIRINYNCKVYESEDNDELIFSKQSSNITKYH